ncbi:MAG TPA: NADH-quinone oxidoreductase subunit N [Bryobacteraceae bacterium]
MTALDYLALFPPLLMAVFGCATLLVDFITRHKQLLVLLNVAGLVLMAYAYVRQWQTVSAHGDFTALQGAVAVDSLAIFTNVIVWIATAGLLGISYRYLEFVEEHRGEYYAVALFAQCGMYFMTASVDLVALFIGLELTAISFYILVGFTRRDRQANEAALKYLLLGALSSAFVVYGFSLLYGIAGSTALSTISSAVHQRAPFDPFVLLGILTATVGLLFKISAVPFHTWAPDAYEGAPTPVTAYLSVASKIAAFAVLIRILWLDLPFTRPVWEPVLVAAAVLSLTIGSIAALTQDRLKRLFAYSSIAHAGYILLGFVAGTPLALRGVYVYLLIYAVMNFGAFAVLASLRRHGIFGDNLSDLRGLSQTHPIHSALFVVLLLSLAGMPPTAGFIAKYFIFAALIETGHFALAVVAAVYAAISLYIYFRLVREMYLSRAETREPIAASLGVRLSLAVASAITVLLGVFPEPLLHLLTGGSR